MITKHKHALILSLSLLVLAIFIAGCTLPPEPNAPSPAGRARAAVTGYAEPNNFNINPSTQLAFEPGATTADASLTVNSYTYIYKKGYYLKNDQWQQYDFSETPVSNSNWIATSATKTISVGTNDVPEGTDKAAFLAYACTRQGAGWDCNSNKWMIYTLDVLKKECSTANSYSCAGQILTQCNANYKLNTVQTCSAGATCNSNAGRCEECSTPNQYSCDGQTLKQCRANYTFTTIQTCSTGQTCNATQGSCVIAALTLPPEPPQPGQNQTQTNQTTNATLGVNLALNKSVTAKEATLNPERAVDDAPGAWKTNYVPDAWLYVDLGAVYSVNSISAKWYWDDISGRYPTSSISFFISSDASSWTKVADKVLNLTTQNKDLNYDFSAVNARYVKILSNNGAVYIELDNFRVYGASS